MSEQQETDNDKSVVGNGTASYYIPRCGTLRQLQGLTINALARAANVDRSRISLLEKNHPVTGAIAGRVFQALNNAHGKTLSYDDEVTTFPATP